MNETNEWIKKQEKVYANEGFDEPDRLLKNIGTDKVESRFTALIDSINSKIKNKKVFTMLETGCASGAISFYVANTYEGAHIDIIDLTEVINKISTTHERVNPLSMDLNKQFPEKRYDIIYATEVLEHLYNDWQFFVNCYKSLKKNGRLIITAPMGINMFGQEDSLHIRVYPKNMLDNLLRLAGFIIIRSWEENERKRIIATKTN